PVPPTTLIGRDEVTQTLAELLHAAEVRLLTLVGPPGVGKTRLAIHVATSVASAFRTGVCFVELAAVHDSTQVLPTIAAAMGLHKAGSQSLLETLDGSLRDSHVLLVLDNFEQVSAAAADVARLLTAAENLKVLVTSRTVLHVNGEQIYRVAPLSLPDLNHETVPESPAVTLF